MSMGNREVAWLYTDGSLEHEKTVGGIGGGYFPTSPDMGRPLCYGEYMNPQTPGYNNVAPIAMYAILRAAYPFGAHVET